MSERLDRGRVTRLLRWLMLQGLRGLRAAQLTYYEIFLAPRGDGWPIPTETWERQYRTGHWDIFESTDELPRYACLAAYLRNHPVRPAVLDVGCGYGRLLKELEGFPLKEYVGIDLSSEAIGRARSHQYPNASFEVTDFTEWRPRSKFDVVIFNESLYYASDPVQVLVPYFDALEEHGSVIVSMFRHRNTMIIWKNIARRFSVVDALAIRNRKGELTDIRVLKKRAEVGCGARESGILRRVRG